MNVKKNVLADKSFAFAIRIVKLYKHLNEKKKEYVLSKQVLRSGTSIGANVSECNNAESDMDFIHNLAIAQKECSETVYWIDLLQAAGFIDDSSGESIKNDATELLRIIKSSILTVKQNRKS